MKSVIRHILSVAVLFCLISGVQAQSVKVNIPFWLTGSPNVGFEYTLTRQLTVNGEVLWMPYLFKKHEEVFRALQSSVELRYYVNPRNFYTNDSWDGFYIGPYAMYGNFNIGLLKHNDPLQSYRRKGWECQVVSQPDINLLSTLVGAGSEYWAGICAPPI